MDYKLETYLKIAQLYLEDDDAIKAEAYLNRAAIIQADTTNTNLQMLYKVCGDIGNYRYRSQTLNNFLITQ